MADGGRERVEGRGCEGEDPQSEREREIFKKNKMGRDKTMSSWGSLVRARHLHSVKKTPIIIFSPPASSSSSAGLINY